jgi:hypothetical protein
MLFLWTNIEKSRLYQQIIALEQVKSILSFPYIHVMCLDI